MTRTERAVLWTIVAVAFGLRLGWALHVRGEAPVRWQDSGDQYSYYRYGTDIAHGRGYVHYVFHRATAYYPIGYPAILGGLFFVVLHTPLTDDLMLSAALFHVVLGTASVALAFVVGRHIASVRVGLLAAGLLALFPNMIYQVASLQLETTFVFLVLVAVAVIVSHDWSAGPPGWQRLAVFGFALGVAVLVRPFALVLIAGLAGALLVSRLPWRAVLGGLAIPLAVVVLLSTPWTIRNYVQLDAFIPSSTNMGDTLCIDRNLDAKGGFRYADHDGCVDPSLPEVPRNRGNTRKAIEFVTEHPDRELLQIVRRARFMFASDHDGIEAVQTLGGGPTLSQDLVDVAEPVADWYFYVVVGLAIVGVPQLAKRDQRPGRLIVASGLLGLLAIPLLLWGNPRFHLPLAPFFVLTAALALDALLRRARPRRTE